MWNKTLSAYNRSECGRDLYAMKECPISCYSVLFCSIAAQYFKFASTLGSQTVNVDIIARFNLLAAWMMWKIWLFRNKISSAYYKWSV